MTVRELNRGQLIELKQRHYIEEYADERVSMGELANIDDIVTDDEVFRAYEGIYFVEDDFFSKTTKVEADVRFVCTRVYKDYSVKVTVGTYDDVCKEIEHELDKSNDDEFKAVNMVVEDRLLGCDFTIKDRVDYSELVDTYYNDEGV